MAHGLTPLFVDCIYLDDFAAYTDYRRIRNRTNAESALTDASPRPDAKADLRRHRRHLIPLWLRRLLVRSAAHRYYPMVVAMVAFFATVTFSFPFAAILIPAVLLSPKRWFTIGLVAGIASGLGAGLLVEIFHHLGREVVFSRYPELVQLQAWQWAGDWLQSYGLIALLIIAASPMPQTPALLFCALGELSVPGIMIVVGIGKTAKYLFLAWATARYPARFLRYG